MLVEHLDLLASPLAITDGSFSINQDSALLKCFKLILVGFLVISCNDAR